VDGELGSGRRARMWDETHASTIDQRICPALLRFFKADSFTALHGDVVKRGEFVIFTYPDHVEVRNSYCLTNRC
jgi:hypothetical protein